MIIHESKQVHLVPLKSQQYSHVGIQMKALDELNPFMLIFTLYLTFSAFYGKPRIQLKPPKG